MSQPRIPRRTLLRLAAGGAGTAALTVAVPSVPGSAEQEPTASKARMAPQAAPVPGRGTRERTRTGVVGGAAYRVRIPARWNGTLVLYSQADPISLDAADPVTDRALLERGYGLAGSALNNDQGAGSATASATPAPRPWPVEDAFREQIALLDLVEREIGRPERTIAWGNSLSGLVAAGLVQTHPDRFAGALPRCGLLGGGVAALNGFLDLQFALKTLLAPDDPGFSVAAIPEPAAASDRALGALREALTTPEGRARVTLAAALGQIPDRFGTRSPQPPASDHAARAQQQAAWLGFFVLPLSIRTRAYAARRAGGSPTSNSGVDYRALFARAPLRDLAAALYEESGLDLDADLRALDAAPRVEADPAAVDYLRRYVVFDGRIAVPVLTLHETADGAAIAANEAAYAGVVAAAGKAALLRQVYVDRASHCVLTPAEMLAAFEQLVRRIDTDAWDDDALTPEALNAAARTLGPDANQIVRQRPEQQDAGPAEAAFVPFQALPLLRPFDARTPNPTVGTSAP